MELIATAFATFAAKVLDSGGHHRFGHEGLVETPKLSQQSGQWWMSTCRPKRQEKTWSIPPHCVVAQLLGYHQKRKQRNITQPTTAPALHGSHRFCFLCHLKGPNRCPQELRSLEHHFEARPEKRSRVEKEAERRRDEELAGSWCQGPFFFPLRWLGYGWKAAKEVYTFWLVCMVAEAVELVGHFASCFMSSCGWLVGFAPAVAQDPSLVGSFSDELDKCHEEDIQGPFTTQWIWGVISHERPQKSSKSSLTHCQLTWNNFTTKLHKISKPLDSSLNVLIILSVYCKSLDLSTAIVCLTEQKPFQLRSVDGWPTMSSRNPEMRRPETAWEIGWDLPKEDPSTT